MRMRAAILEEVNQPLRVEEIEIDPPREGEVLVKMVASGVCHSDVNAWTGDKLITPLPCVLGHEGAGIVQEVGPKVEDVKAGDHVVLTYLPSCGKCRWCHTGHSNMCDMGKLIPTGTATDGTHRLHRTDGSPLSNFLFVSTFAEYTVCPAASVVVVPDYVNLAHVCLFGCGFVSGYGAVTNAVHIRPGESITIVGCGGLGLAAVQGARRSGAGKIIAVDIHEEKLAMARRFGATHTIRNRGDIDDVCAQIKEITWGVGTDFGFEFVGHSQAPQTLALAFRVTRKRGTVGMVGVGPRDMGYLPFSPWDIVHYRMRIVGVLYGDAQFRVDVPRYVRDYTEGRIDLENMITTELRLEEINQAIENLLSGQHVARQIIRFD